MRWVLALVLVLMPMGLLAQFTGGPSDGESAATVTQSGCAPFSTDFVFQGGPNDGFGTSRLTQGTCAPPTTDFVFAGGSSDGFGNGELIQGICLPPTTDFVFSGGSSDGFSNGELIQEVCLPFTTDFVFRGGNRDGYGLGIIEQTACPDTTPLPVVLLEFKAVLGKEGVEVSWITATEINNDYFTVERSNHGLGFQPIAVVPGAGNSSQRIKYSITDGSPFQGLNYYRLKQTDFDGQFEYSTIIAVQVDDPFVTNSIYPNPTDGAGFHVQLAKPGARYIRVMIQSLDGREVLNKFFYGESTIDVNPEFGLAAGLYLVTIIDNVIITRHKLVVR